jgi:hypothetical protein
MTLVVTFVALLVGLLALFLGLAVTLQRLFDAAPADRLVIRAVVAALAMAIFLTGWTYLNTRAAHKDQYGTLFEFSATARSPVEEFKAVRRLRFKENGKYREETVSYVWVPGSAVNGGEFVEKPGGKKFSRSSADYVTIALVIERDGQPVRLVAPVEELKYVGLTQAQPNVVFSAESGRSYVSDENLHAMETPSSGGLVLVLAVNALHFVLWFVLFWPVMRFRVGMSLLLAALFGAVTMFILMPLLFQANAVKPVPIVATP